MKTVVVLAAVSAIILGLALWILWPSQPNDRPDRLMGFAQKSAPTPTVIDPPFGFRWGDSMTRVEALLGNSSAEIVTRMATGEGETWMVEGLIQAGLKNVLLVFENNALTAVELQCQYDAWSSERYRNRLEELRVFFDGRYGEKQHGQPMSLNDKNGSNAIGYLWRLGDTNLSVLCRTDFAPSGKRLLVNSFTIRYNARPTATDPASPISGTDHWANNAVLPAVARKVQPNGDDAPVDSDLGITSAKLLNTSDRNQTAFTLQLAVKLQPETMINPTKTAVEVNFYDTLPNGEIILTNADVGYDWQSHRDWKKDNPETLSVNYIRTNSDSSPDGSSRRFFGFVATVYYDGRLESVRAEPLSLVNLFPVRTFVSPFETAKSAAERKDFAAAVNLYRRAADQGNLLALENLAWFYAHGQGVEKDSRQAAAYYERAALQNTPDALNALAWFLATCEDDSIRNGQEAARNATRACELTYWQEWKYIDTLAAAWAEAGDFKRAIEFEQQALQLKGLDEDSQKKMEDRLALYRKRQPVRE